MPIVRSKRKRHNFTIIDNTGLMDGSLSWKATGMLAFLMTKPDDWVINVENLTHSKRDKHDSTVSALEELKKAGYVYHKRYREQGRLQSEYLVFETKEDLGEWLTEQGIEESELVDDHNGKSPVVDEKILNNHRGKTTVEKPRWKNHGGKTTVEKPLQVINKEVITEKAITEEAITEKTLSPNPLSNLPPEERERVLEFGRKKAARMPEPPELVERWIIKHAKEILREYLASPEGKEAKQQAIAQKYDFENHPRRDEYFQLMFDNGSRWAQEVEAEREFRTAFDYWGNRSGAYVKYLEEVGLL